MRNVIFLAVLLVLGGLSVMTQARRYVLLRLELPNGDMRDMRTREGPATAQIQLQDGQEWRDFYLDLMILENAGCRALVSIRGGRQAESPTLDEFELSRDGAVITTNTVPAFGLGLRAVEGC